MQSGKNNIKQRFGRRAGAITLGLAATCMLGASSTQFAFADHSDTAKAQPTPGSTKVAGVNKHNVPVQPVSNKQKDLNQRTADAVNDVPGGDTVDAKDLQPPTAQAPIKGFHPIKKALAPIIQLQQNVVQMQQQIMKLEGPIASLQPTMLGLKEKMTHVEGKMGTVDNRMTTVNGGLDEMQGEVKDVRNEMQGVRSDITAMRKQIGQLEGPIRDIQKPLNDLRGPLLGVSEPLTQVRNELAQMKTLLATILGGIVLATVAIAIGTPIAAIYVFRNRFKLFPDLKHDDLPVAAPVAAAPAQAQSEPVKEETLARR